jgi:hypothetical protein
MNDEYLGDGVYASFDGHMIVLDLRGQDNTTMIALEPEVLDNLIRYARKYYGDGVGRLRKLGVH